MKSRRFWIFHTLFWSLHAAIFTFGWFKQKNNNELRVINSIGNSIFIARAAGLVLAVDCALLLLAVCRNLITLSRQSFLNRWIPFDENLYFHRWVAYSMLFFTIIHVNAHYNNFYMAEYQLSEVGMGTAWSLHFKQWAGVTGHIMLFVCFMMFTSVKREVKQKNFEIFW